MQFSDEVQSLQESLKESATEYTKFTYAVRRNISRVENYAEELLVAQFALTFTLIISLSKKHSESALGALFSFAITLILSLASIYTRGVLVWELPLRIKEKLPWPDQ